MQTERERETDREREHAERERERESGNTEREHRQGIQSCNQGRGTQKKKDKRHRERQIGGRDPAPEVGSCQDVSSRSLPFSARTHVYHLFHTVPLQTRQVPGLRGSMDQELTITPPQWPPIGASASPDPPGPSSQPVFHPAPRTHTSLQLASASADASPCLSPPSAQRLLSSFLLSSPSPPQTVPKVALPPAL